MLICFIFLYKVLTDNKISCVPVYNKQLGSYVGLVDLMDIAITITNCVQSTESGFFFEYYFVF